MKTTYDKLYQASPIWFQNIMTSVYGYKLYKQRYSKAYYEYLDYLRQKTCASYESEMEDQNAQLKRLVSHAVSNSKFYQTFYAGIKLDEIQTINDLYKLPILEKELLRANAEDIYTIEPRDGITCFTGGTTGKSIKVIFSKEDMQKRMAYLDHYKAQFGVYHGMRRATFSGRQFILSTQKKNIFWRNNFILKQRLYSTFDMKPENLQYYVEDLNNFKPQTINGFVSAIYEIASYIKSQRVPITYHPLCIFTTSETLLPFHRQMIEEVFRCPVRDQYASSEGAPFITECAQGNLHYNMDTGIIEPYETEYGTEMLVTSFTTYGTPLIRYRIGDMIQFHEGTTRCPCNSPHPMVDRIEGRQVDYLYSKEKGKISLSHLADVIKGMPNCIENMQFIQYSPTEISVLIVIDKSKYHQAHEAMILHELTFRFGKDTTFDLKYVNEIEREKSGKYRLIVNKVPSDMPISVPAAGIPVA